MEILALFVTQTDDYFKGILKLWLCPISRYQMETRWQTSMCMRHRAWLQTMVGQITADNKLPSQMHCNITNIRLLSNCVTPLYEGSIKHIALLLYWCFNMLPRSVLRLLAPGGLACAALAGTDLAPAVHNDADPRFNDAELKLVQVVFRHVFLSLSSTRALHLVSKALANGKWNVLPACHHLKLRNTRSRSYPSITITVWTV